MTYQITKKTLKKEEQFIVRIKDETYQIILSKLKKHVSYTIIDNEGNVFGEIYKNYSRLRQEISEHIHSLFKSVKLRKELLNSVDLYFGA